MATVILIAAVLVFGYIIYVQVKKSKTDKTKKRPFPDHPENPEEKRKG